MTAHPITSFVSTWGTSRISVCLWINLFFLRPPVTGPQTTHFSLFWSFTGAKPISDHGLGFCRVLHSHRAEQGFGSNQWAKTHILETQAKNQPSKDPKRESVCRTPSIKYALLVSVKYTEGTRPSRPSAGGQNKTALSNHSVTSQKLRKKSTAFYKINDRGFPGGLVAKTPCYHCRGAQVQSLVRELDPTCHN